ncbi:leucine-rich repeat-containing protein 28-like isoform X2 [Cimex lectularius]|uniref:Disease resistance R13L4/SHOC-2-like LRR domain-containing protein n=1 Tax=Cimex lectularius TaxID=79782 RepID=A0A8I6RIW4_CIMLE|nr:leucine-rich repeat-containing protein 28-like isoform X2 [Cimex lectularius]
MEQLEHFDWIHNMKLLTSMFLVGNDITTLPDNIGLLKFLSVLELQSNQLEQLPKTIGRLKNLNILNLQNNKLTFIPTEIKDLKALAILNLRGNKITHLPPLLFHLKSLQELVLDNNHLTSLPLDIVYLPNLTFLSLNGNKLRFLPFEKFISSPMISIINNSQLNYLSYDLGCAMTQRCSLLTNSSLWHFDLTGCASENIKSDECLNNILISIPSFDKIITLPKIIRKVFYSSNFQTPSLFELSLRIIHDLCFKVIDTRQCLFPEIINKLPMTIKSMLYEGPVAKCHYCEKSLFTECILWLMQRNFYDQMPANILGSVLFCSPQCSISFVLFEDFEKIHDRLKFNTIPWKLIERDLET